ncbi:MAG: TRAP transporter substrate-binding protein [Syntrophomonadaceae bacterium]|nr:TRAP transporter substrate-binding protein [Syntrophomonadaceae bacterium]
MVVLVTTLLAGCANKPQSEQKNTGNVKTIAFRMSQTSAADGAIGLAMEKFRKLIEEKTKGRYTIHTFHSGQLGSERENIESVQMGDLDIAIVNQAPLANFVPEIAAVDLPYVIKSFEHADKVFLGEIGNSFLNKLADRGIQGLSIWESGFRNLTNSKRPVNSLKDVRGLRIRVMQNKIHQDLWRTFGADPVPMAWGEAYTALQQGAVDGQENPATVIDKNKVVEVNKHMAITQHVYSTVFIIMSKKAWGTLSAEDQKIFKAAAEEAGAYQRELSRKMDKEAITNLEKAGMKVTYPNKQEFIDASQPVRDNYGKEFADLLKKIENAK